MGYGSSTSPRREPYRLNQTIAVDVLLEHLRLDHAHRIRRSGGDSCQRYNRNMLSLEQLRSRRKEILEIAQRYGASQVRVFSSVARGEANAESDIDFLVKFEPTRSLIDQALLKQDLEALLERPVDVVSENGINPLLRNRILSEAIPL